MERASVDGAYDEPSASDGRRVPMYVSAQAFDFLAAAQNPLFRTRKRHCIHPEFPDGYQLLKNQWSRS